MKLTTKHKLLAAALLAGTAQLSFAADNNAPYVGVMGTYLFPDQDRQLDNGLGATALLGFPVNSYFAPEINAYGLRADRSLTTGADKIWGAGLNFAIYPLTRNAAVAPFLLIGGGAERDQRSSNSRTNGVANASGGFLINLNQARTAALRVEAGRYGIFDGSVQAGRNYILDTRISAGVQIALGGSAPMPAPTPAAAPIAEAAPAPAPTPAPAPAPAAPKDSDGDGVLDSVDQCPNTPVGMKVDANGCAIQAAKVVLHDITFATDKDVLTTEAKASLDNIVAGLKGQPSMNLQVDGHTDSTGTAPHNLKLSKERAAAAKKYLVEKGIAASRLQTEGYGQTKPIASNKTKAGRAENRRVEFKVIK
jgi:outer membrane protein OmpA-like peptidoglycan-associated protein